MASSRAEQSPAARLSRKAFALTELAAYWDQGYEALLRGDLDAVAALLDLADEQLAGLQVRTAEPAEFVDLQEKALQARGRLEHGMRLGLTGLREEIARAAKGARTLQGYRNSASGQPSAWDRRA